MCVISDVEHGAETWTMLMFGKIHYSTEDVTKLFGWGLNKPGYVNAAEDDLAEHGLLTCICRMLIQLTLGTTTTERNGG